MNGAVFKSSEGNAAVAGIAARDNRGDFAQVGAARDIGNGAECVYYVAEHVPGPFHVAVH